LGTFPRLPAHVGQIQSRHLKTRVLQRQQHVVRSMPNLQHVTALHKRQRRRLPAPPFPHRHQPAYHVISSVKLVVEQPETKTHQSKPRNAGRGRAQNHRNDLDGTVLTFGFDTAVSFATECVDRLQATAESHKRIMTIEW
jgi:hypothetical protein